MVPVPSLCNDSGLWARDHKSEVPHDEFIVHGTYSDIGKGLSVSVLTGKNHERPIEGCQYICACEWKTPVTHPIGCKKVQSHWHGREQEEGKCYLPGLRHRLWL
jgi:hypothetical protein